jgi:hypothetical protein
MDVCAMPGDADLDLDLSELRLSAVVRAEQRFLLQTRGGTGRYTSDGRLVGTDEWPVSDITLSFAMADPPGAEGVTDLTYTVLMGWRDRGALLRLIGAPGRQIVLFEPGGFAIPLATGAHRVA